MVAVTGLRPGEVGEKLAAAIHPPHETAARVLDLLVSAGLRARILGASSDTNRR